MRVSSRGLLACVALAVTATLFAQTPTVTVKPGHKQAAAQLEQEILSKLNLTPTQVDQAKAAFKTMASSLKELRKSEKGLVIDPQEKKTKTQAIRKTYNDSLKTILTPAQWVQLREIRKELRKKAEEAKAAAAAGTTPPKSP